MTARTSRLPSFQYLIPTIALYARPAPSLEGRIRNLIFPPGRRAVIRIWRDQSTGRKGFFSSGVWHYGIKCPYGVIHFCGQGTPRIRLTTMEEFKLHSDKFVLEVGYHHQLFSIVISLFNCRQACKGRASKATARRSASVLAHRQQLRAFRIVLRNWQPECRIEAARWPSNITWISSAWLRERGCFWVLSCCTFRHHSSRCY